MTTYRAAYTRQTADYGEILLTLPEHANLSDAELIAEALHYARSADAEAQIELTEDDIEVGDWTEA